MNTNFYHFLRGLKSHDPSLPSKPKNIEIVVMLDVSQNTSKCRTMCSWRILHRVVWKISSRVDKARTPAHRTTGQCNFCGQFGPIHPESTQKKACHKKLPSLPCASYELCTNADFNCCDTWCHYPTKPDLLSVDNYFLRHAKKPQILFQWILWWCLLQI